MILGLLFAIWFYRNYPEQKALLDRARQQHELLMSGDDCGLYGDYPPSAICHEAPTDRWRRRTSRSVLAAAPVSRGRTRMGIPRRTTTSFGCWPLRTHDDS